MNFERFIIRVQAVLDSVHVTLPVQVPLVSNSYESPSMPKVGLKCQRYLPEKLEDICSRREPCTSNGPALPPLIEARVSAPIAEATRSISDTQKLASIVKQFEHGPHVLHSVYGSALKTSLESYILELDSATSKANAGHSVSLLDLDNEYELRRCEFEEIYELVMITLSPKTPLDKAVAGAGQWPSLRLRPLFSLLSKDKLDFSMSSGWDLPIVALAQAFLKLQRSRRMLFYKSSGLEEDLSKELHNVEYETDVSFRRPEWLLIQSRVAQEMIFPSSGQNSLTQLNMGEGKSAVIVPLVSSALADGQTLVRVVVLKPLVNQMFDLLVHRLSGLTDRRIFYLPFSRDFTPEMRYLQQIQSLYETCVQEKGVLLIQPEHILSFRLMGIDLLSGLFLDAAKQLIESHRWLLSTSRDVLDESDEILRATYQLVYTSGLQEPMDNHPDRWTIIQELMVHVQKQANILHAADPAGLEVDHAEGISFPTIRILEAEAGDALIDSVIRELLSSNRFRLLPPHIHRAAEDFIRCRCSNATATDELRSFLHRSSTWKDLLLYRGLLGHGLLRFVLQEKRWRVDYGLDLTRTLLAVPYRAKDLPSLRADFGHPDVALALTCLSYYYGGLTEEQLGQCFELLFKHDDPPLEYNQWVSGHKNVPPPFRDIRSVNLDDEHQRKMILGPLFRKNKAVIDFYLSNLVFPRYAKQFPKKLSTSAWDLAETKSHTTTGFSGTNDNRYLLPTSIQQDDTLVGDYDPFGQLATNAKVLSILLRPENGAYRCVEDYKRRNDAWVFHERDPSASGSLAKLRSSWEEPDAQTLGEMYEARPDQDATSFHSAFKLPNLKERLDLLGVSVLSDFRTDEEQERQVSREAEKERQRELPPKVKWASSRLHEALKSLIKSCNFKPGPSSPFIPLFSPLSSEHGWSDALFSTQDFARTVEGGASVGDFLRPVNWILSVPAHRVLIVLSPFEVNELLELIWKSKHVHLHIYAPRVNQNMKTTEDL
ncbi:hypothetical protein C0993_011064, partial [Termitomyces sp. T159_Od127]